MTKGEFALTFAGKIIKSCDIAVLTDKVKYAVLKQTPVNDIAVCDLYNDEFELLATDRYYYKNALPFSDITDAEQKAINEDWLKYTDGNEFDLYNEMYVVKELTDGTGYIVIKAIDTLGGMISACLYNDEYELTDYNIEYFYKGIGANLPCTSLSPTQISKLNNLI